MGSLPINATEEIDSSSPTLTPSQTLPQQLTSGSTEGIFDVASNGQKVDTEVKEGVIVSLDAVVLYRGSTVKLGPCVHLKLACGNIHNMGDAQLD